MLLLVDYCKGWRFNTKTSYFDIVSIPSFISYVKRDTKEYLPLITFGTNNIIIEVM